MICTLITNHPDNNIILLHYQVFFFSKNLRYYIGLPYALLNRSNFVNNFSPPPDQDQQKRSVTLKKKILKTIQASNNWIPFDQYQSACLFDPDYGYYMSPSPIFGIEGDFITAPTLSPFYAELLFVQIDQIMRLSNTCILEVGAGNGQLASNLMKCFSQKGKPFRYMILEASPTLIDIQKQLFEKENPECLPYIQWPPQIPADFEGCIIANELLDALPVRCFQINHHEILEKGVSQQSGQLLWQNKPADPQFLKTIKSLGINNSTIGELNLAAQDWVRNAVMQLKKGGILLIDYGLTQSEYYCSQRTEAGSLRGYYRHQLVTDLFSWPGLTDITSHVNFTQIAEAAHQAALDILGFSSQAYFLMNCQIATGKDLLDHSRFAMLTSPNEMGEIFKVMVLGKNLNNPNLIGFQHGNQVHRL